MKAVILAGSLGTRLSEETEMKPKPLIEIGGKPILWHILKIYSAHGINDFIICCGLPISVKELVEDIADQYNRRDLLRFGVRSENLVDPSEVVGIK